MKELSAKWGRPSIIELESYLSQFNERLFLNFSDEHIENLNCVVSLSKLQKFTSSEISTLKSFLEVQEIKDHINEIRSQNLFITTTFDNRYFIGTTSQINYLLCSINLFFIYGDLPFFKARWRNEDSDSLDEEDYLDIYNRFQNSFPSIFSDLFFTFFDSEIVEEFIKLKHDLKNTDRYRKLVYAPSGQYHFINKIYDDIFQLLINWLFTYLDISTSKVPIFESNYQKGLNLEKHCLAILKGKKFSAELTKSSGDYGVDIVAISEKYKLNM